MSKDTGGPAFPCGLQSGHLQPLHGGMTLRDYFAAKVLVGIWANTEVLCKVPGGDESSKNIAAVCYEMADAMLAERNKQ